MKKAILAILLVILMILGVLLVMYFSSEDVDERSEIEKWAQELEAEDVTETSVWYSGEDGWKETTLSADETSELIKLINKLTDKDFTQATTPGTAKPECGLSIICGAKNYGINDKSE